MKYLLTVFALLITATPLPAEEWVLTTDMSFSLNQTTYSDNWDGDEQGTISWTVTSHTRAHRKLSEIFMWRNNLRLAYGQTHQQTTGEDGETSWGRPQKSTDKIDLESIMRATLKQYADPFISFRWESQFIDRSDKVKTLMLNPNRFTESAGLARDFLDKEDHMLTSRLGAAFRQKYNRSDLPEVEELTYDGGIESVTEYHKRFPAYGINFDSRLLLYQALFHSQKDDDPDDHWRALDITWENNVTTRIWSVINLVFSFDLIYDKEQDRSAQFRQHLGIGVSWQL